MLSYKKKSIVDKLDALALFRTTWRRQYFEHWKNEHVDELKRKRRYYEHNYRRINKASYG